MSDAQFVEKFIAFIDILGFSSLVAASETGSGKPLSEILGLVRLLADGGERANFEKYGSMTCPGASKRASDLDFRATQVSDCAVLSAEVSPAGAINLVSHCWGAAIELLSKGMLCRGYITRGMIYHTDTQFFGTGYQRAYGAESGVAVFSKSDVDRGTPYIALDNAVVSYIDGLDDRCVQMVFKRLVKRVGDSVALFPFSSLQHSFMLPTDGSFNADGEHENNDMTRHNLLRMKALVLRHTNVDSHTAIRKTLHYLDAIDVQLEKCHGLDGRIEMHRSWLT